MIACHLIERVKNWKVGVLGTVVVAALAALPAAAPAQTNTGNRAAGELGSALARLLTGPRKVTVRTTLDADNVRAHGELKPARKTFSPFHNYQPWPSCTYSYLNKKADGTVVTDVLSYSSKAVKDRLLVTVKHKRGTSTALIGRDGTAHDFNWVDIDDGQRLTSENYAATTKRLLDQARAKARAKGAPENITFINPMSTAFPVLLKNSLAVGETAALITKVNDQLYGEYVYAGTLTYKGFKSVLLEIYVNRDGAAPGGPVLIGYTILRQDNMMPLRFVWQIDRLMLTEMIHCG